METKLAMGCYGSKRKALGTTGFGLFFLSQRVFLGCLVFLTHGWTDQRIYDRKRGRRSAPTVWPHPGRAPQDDCGVMDLAERKAHKHRNNNETASIGVFWYIFVFEWLFCAALVCLFASLYGLLAFSQCLAEVWNLTWLQRIKLDARDC